MDQLTICRTEDGSFTFTSGLYGEAFHSLSGARAEAIYKFVVPSGIASRAERGSVHILDVCFGLGYNTAAALDCLADYPTCTVGVIGLENNLGVLEAAIRENLLTIWSDRTQALLGELAEKLVLQQDCLQLRLIIADARQGIQQVPDQWADAIFFDPFSPRRCPQLWTIDFCRLVANKLKPDGYIVTYSCASAVRSAWQELGLCLWAVEPLGRKSPGTIASFCKEVIPKRSRPLTAQEYAILQTRAGIPYRDPQLQDTAEQIIQRRQQEQKQSDRQTSSQWLKQNLKLMSNHQQIEV